jgi:hypothetical protein
MHDTSDSAPITSSPGWYLAFVNIAAAICAVVFAAWLGTTGLVVWHHTIAPLVDVWTDMARPAITAGVDATLVPLVRAFGREVVIAPMVQDYLTIGFLLVCIGVARLRSRHAAFGMSPRESSGDLVSPASWFTYALLFFLWPIALWFLYQFSSLLYVSSDDDKPPRVGVVLVLPIVYFAALFALNQFLSKAPL